MERPRQQPVEPSLQRLTTEQVNPRTANIDMLSALDIVTLMNEEDQLVGSAVKAVLPAVAQVVDIIVERMRRGGRLLYIGAGTSGRLGVLDASECPPTFGTDPDQIMGIIAGGDAALRNSIEGAEDDAAAGAAAMVAYTVSGLDCVCGLSASGRAPYVLGALREARARGAATAGVCCVAQSAFVPACDIVIAPVVGPEVLTGSTRLKAGTAQKLVLNMLTTASMIRLGKAYRNFMVDVRASNAKLQDRAARITATLGSVDYTTAWAALESSDFAVKVAIVTLLQHVTRLEAEHLLGDARGVLRAVIGDVPL